MNQCRPALGWRIFAVFMAITVLPYEFPRLVSLPAPYEAMRSAVSIIGIIGLLAYAFGWRMGPATAWRVFAPVFVFVALSDLLIGVVGITWLGPVPRVFLIVGGAVLMLWAPATWFTSIALLRVGGWLRPSAARA